MPHYPQGSLGANSRLILPAQLARLIHIAPETRQNAGCATSNVQYIGHLQLTDHLLSMWVCVCIERKKINILKLRIGVADTTCCGGVCGPITRAAR